MKIFVAVSIVVASSVFAQTPSPSASASAKHPFTFEDMMKLKRLDEPVPSPDGKRLIWTSKATDPTQIWMCDFSSESGQLVGKPHQVTNISTGADGAIWSPDGKNIVFVSAVYPDCKDDACNKQRDDELKKSKVKAKIFTKLFYRHWNAFTEFKRSHLFAVSADANLTGLTGQVSGAGTSGPIGEPRDLTPGDHDVPPFHLGGQDMYAISPDGQELAYTSNIDEVEAASTNNEIFIVPMAGGNHQSGSDPKKISTSPGSDSTPLYSPDGKYLAWRSQARAGFEADKWRLVLQDRQSGKAVNLTDAWRDSVGQFTWAKVTYPTGLARIELFLTGEDQGETPVWHVAPNEPDSIAYFLQLPIQGRPSPEYHIDDLVSDGKDLFFTRNSISAPNEIWKQLMPDGETISSDKYHPDQLTHMNDAVLSNVDMRPLEVFWFKGANNEEVQGFMVKPPGFAPNKKYPLKFLIHGGPQGAWGNSWSYRWNPELFAANGYVAVMINFHGSTGYGQKFTDSISGDWGGKPYVDLMKGLDYVEKKYPFIDKNREAALGASYGGYMANWILGHTDRFKCIVSHDGTFNTESVYGTTEELWFPEWEFQGPPGKNRELYRKFSPHLFADKFKTPTLVVHGQNDYRLDVSEGFQLFTTLQRLKIPSKFLYFPDEGHWVLKPQNSQLWYKTVNDWVDQWCK